MSLSEPFIKIMNSPPRVIWTRISALLLAAALLTATACHRGQLETNARTPGATLTSAEREIEAQVKAETIRAVTEALTANEMQGRGTGQAGGQKAADYLAARFAEWGLKPLGDGGSFMQTMKFKSAQVQPDTSFTVGQTKLKLGEEFIIMPPYDAERRAVAGRLICVGYGVTAPELKHDDLAGLDVKGKIAVVLSGRPASINRSHWEKVASPEAISDRLASLGAVGVIFTKKERETETPGFAFMSNYIMRRSVWLAGLAPSTAHAYPLVAQTSSQASERLFEGAERSFAQALEAAARGETVAGELAQTVRINTHFQLEESTGSNVLGYVEGSDASLKGEAVIYTAHYDAYGLATDGRVYPGAADNALGVGMMMAVAEAFAHATNRPRRSVIFLAPTGEEYGLLGSSYWVHHPTWPIGKLAADVNFDSVGTEVYGPVKRIIGFGREQSDLAAVLEAVVAATGNTLIPDPLPEQRAFSRSDHLSLAEQGVPVLMISGAPDGDNATWINRAQQWLETNYHQPSDVVGADWHWEGAQSNAKVGLLVGWRVANNDAMPKYLPSSPYNRERR